MVPNILLIIEISLKSPAKNKNIVILKIKDFFC